MNVRRGLMGSPALTIGLLLATAAAVAAVILELPLAVRAPLVLAWVLVVPGWAWARRVRFDDRADEVTVGIALSASLLAIIGAAMALTGVWAPVPAVLVLVAVAVAGLVLPDRSARSAAPAQRPEGALGEGVPPQTPDREPQAT